MLKQWVYNPFVVTVDKMNRDPTPRWYGDSSMPEERQLRI